MQHASFTYTGGYALSFLVNLVDLLYLLHGSASEVTDAPVNNVYD